MKAVGLVAEFNPLHFGHELALQQARRQADADVVVVIMSGNYVQRGEPAILDKWQRTQLALDAGADLVIELPLTDSVQAAEDFAAGALAYLSALNVSTLAFGTEDASLDYAALAQRILDAKPAASAFKDYRQTYASQVNHYFHQLTGQDLTAPNTILGLTYAQANAALERPLALLPFNRVGVAHDADQVSGHYVSASAIRQAVWSDTPITGAPRQTIQALQQPQPLQWRTSLFSLLKYRLQTARLSELQQIYTMAEGLEYRLSQQINACQDFTGFLQAIKSKRYTYARLRRLALYTVLNLTGDEVMAARTQRVLHVLGFSAAGQAYLRQEKKHLAMPLMTKVSRPMLAPDGPLALVQRGDQLLQTYGLAEQNFGRPPIRLSHERKEGV